MSGWEDAHILQDLLRQLALNGSAGLDMLEQITSNVIQHPHEEQFRSVCISNAKFAVLFAVSIAYDVMREMGWEADGEMFILPPGVSFDATLHLGLIAQARQFGQASMNVEDPGLPVWPLEFESGVQGDTAVSLFGGAFERVLCGCFGSRRSKMLLCS